MVLTKVNSCNRLNLVYPTNLTNPVLTKVDRE